jgi:hypothetical protein
MEGQKLNKAQKQALRKTDISGFVALWMLEMLSKCIS